MSTRVKLTGVLFVCLFFFTLALDDLEEELELAMEHSAMTEDEWGNSLPIAEMKHREKVVDLINRKMDKIRVAMGGAKVSGALRVLLERVGLFGILKGVSAFLPPLSLSFLV